MTKPKVDEKKVSDLIPDELNINTHTQKGRGIVEHSIRKYGIGRGIVAAGKGTDTPQIIGGNLTHEIIGSLSMDDVIFVHTKGDKLVVTVRDDIAPNSVEAVALGIIDNESQKQSYNIDTDLLAQMAVGDNALLSALRKEDKAFNGLLEDMGIAQTPKTLEELEAEYGNSEDSDFHPFIRVKVTPEIKERFDAVMVLMPGANEMEKIDALISRGELS